MFSWLDWEETILTEAVVSEDAEGIQCAIQHLQAALGSNAYLVGGTLTLADVIIYVALLPIQVSRLTYVAVSCIFNMHVCEPNELYTTELCNTCVICSNLPCGTTPLWLLHDAF